MDAMTVGVLWEFFEYFADLLLGMDMQKDTVINAIHTVTLDQSLTNTVIHVEDIREVILISADGSQQVLGIGGYLDVGNHDTMKDLLVNLIGAVVFSVNGYIAAARKGKSRIAVKFIPRVNPSDENEEVSP